MKAGASPRARAAILLALSAPAGLGIGMVAGLPWLAPLLVAAPAWLVMARTLGDGERRRAIGLMLWWALWLAGSGVALTLAFPDRAARGILNGVAYREEMFAWLSTGAGRESTPALFVPQHLIHVAIFCALALLTASAAALVMGAALLNYMSFYVAELLRACAAAPELHRAMLLGWNPWSMVRVVSFIVLGVVLAEPLLSRWRPAAALPGRARWIALASLGLLADLLLKGWLAPHWPALLGGCLFDGAGPAP